MIYFVFFNSKIELDDTLQNSNVIEEEPEMISKIESHPSPSPIVEVDENKYEKPKKQCDDNNINNINDINNIDDGREVFPFYESESELNPKLLNNKEHVKSFDSSDEILRISSDEKEDDLLDYSSSVSSDSVNNLRITSNKKNNILLSEKEANENKMRD